MKKILMAAMMLSTMNATDGNVFKFEDNISGGLVQSSVTYVYKKDEKEMPKTSAEAKILAITAKTQVCGDKNIKALIDEGILIQYIYVSDIRAAIVQIDSCSHQK
jgi:hypothetical protein